LAGLGQRLMQYPSQRSSSATSSGCASTRGTNGFLDRTVKQAVGPLVQAMFLLRYLLHKLVLICRKYDHMQRPANKSVGK